MKRAYGAWVMPVFRVLARLRGLRGTRFDPFGYAAERRSERQLLADYESLVDELCGQINASNHAAAVELLGMALRVRGYGLVKERSIESYRAALREAQQRWRPPGVQAAGF